MDVQTECKILKAKIATLEHTVEILCHKAGLHHLSDRLSSWSAHSSPPLPGEVEKGALLLSPRKVGAPSGEDEKKYHALISEDLPSVKKQVGSSESASLKHKKEPVEADMLKLSSLKKHTTPSPMLLESELLHEGSEDIILEASLWDVGVLMFVYGPDGFTLREKLVAMLLVVINISLQTIFVVAVFTTMSGDPYDEITLATVLRQRLMENHQLDMIDTKTHRTKAKMLCENEIHNMLGVTMDEVSSYLQIGDGGGVPGELICLIAMYIWVLSMMVELRRSTDIGLAVISLLPPAGSKSIMSYGNDFVQGGVIDRMSIYAKITLLLTQVVPRLCIAGFLIFGGQFFLASSTSVEDLVLNACALEIVRELDGLLYSALMTKHSRKVVSGTTLRPDRLAVCKGWLSSEVSDIQTSKTAFKSAQNNMFVRIFLSASFVLLGYTLYLKPTVDHAEIANRNMCGKNLDFAYADHPTGMPMFTPIYEGDNTTLSLRCYFDAYSDMVRMRAGFDPVVSQRNETLIRLIDGTHPSCMEPGSPLNHNSNLLDCPSAKYAIVADEMAEADYFKSHYCRDRDVSFLVLRTTCLSKSSYSTNTPMVSLLASRDSCSAIKDICSQGTPTNMPTVNGIRLDYDLQSKLALVCPQSCGKCTQQQGANSGPPQQGSQQPQQQSQQPTSSATPSQAGAPQQPQQGQGAPPQGQQQPQQQSQHPTTAATTSSTTPSPSTAPQQPQQGQGAPPQGQQQPQQQSQHPTTAATTSSTTPSPSTAPQQPQQGQGAPPQGAPQQGQGGPPQGMR